MPLVPLEGCHAYLPTRETILNGKYPLTRALNIYVDRAPGKPLPPLAQEFLSFVLSQNGQTLVASYGSVQVPADQLAAQRARLELP